MDTAATVSPATRTWSFARLKAAPCFAGFFAGCMGCHLLRTELSTGTVTAAALTGLAGSFLPLPERTDKNFVRAAIYSGAFAAMGATTATDTPAGILVVSLAGSLIFLTVSPFFQGLGGKLGMIAFATTALVLLARTFA